MCYVRALYFKPSNSTSSRFRFTTVNINLRAKPEWYLSKHPLGTVPALQKGDDIVIESLICSDYIDEKFPDDRGLHSSNKEHKFRDVGLVAIYGSKVAGERK